MKKYIWIFCISIIPMYADSIIEPYEEKTFSKNGLYVFWMVPDRTEDESHSQQSDEKYQAFGEVYKVNRDKTFTQKWTIKGWYAYQVYLSNDGKYLVRMGDWALGCGVSKSDLAIAFYKEGKLLKSYSTYDLVKNNNSIECTMSHYMWLEEVNMEYENNIFTLKTLEGITYHFDVETGEIVKFGKSL